SKVFRCMKISKPIPASTIVTS
ncbi:hypothetical protein, partial [Cronobacter sakazakii]